MYINLSQMTIYLEESHNSVNTLYRFHCTWNSPHCYEKHFNGIISLHQFVNKIMFILPILRDHTIQWSIYTDFTVLKLTTLLPKAYLWHNFPPSVHKKSYLFYPSQKPSALKNHTISWSLYTGFIVLETHHIAAIFFRFLLPGVLLG